MYRVTRGDGAEAPMLLMDAPACCAEVDMVYCVGVSGVVCVCWGRVGVVLLRVFNCQR